jgi:hypothetical protein
LFFRGSIVHLSQSGAEQRMGFTLGGRLAIFQSHARVDGCPQTMQGLGLLPAIRTYPVVPPGSVMRTQ